MLKVYKNLLFQSVNQGTYGADLFWAQETDNGLVVHVRGSELMFELENAPTSYHLFRFRYREFQPGEPSSAWLQHDDAGTLVEYCHFDFVITEFMEWLKEHVAEFLEEQESTDLWAEVGAYESLFGPSLDEKVNVPFTEAQRDLVRIGLRRYRILLIKNFNPTEEQLIDINRKLDYLTEAANRLNQFDWKGLAISTVVGIGISLSVDTQKGQLLFKLLEQALGNLLKMLH